TVLSVRGVRSLDGIRIKFDEAVDAGSATEPSNYSITDTNDTPITPTGSPTLGADLMTVTIPIPSHAAGTVYKVHIEGVSDIASTPNTMDPTNFTVQMWTVGLGSMLIDTYLGIGGNTIPDLTNNAAYPNNPSEYGHIAAADSRRFYPNDSHEGYGARLSGYLVPPLTANFSLFISSDDASQ